MAQLPPDGQFFIQQVGGTVVLFERYTERELARFDPGDQNGAAIAQGLIHGLDELTDEQKAFAHFWSGYFCAHAGMSDPETDLRDRAPNQGALADVAHYPNEDCTCEHGSPGGCEYRMLADTVIATLEVRDGDEAAAARLSELDPETGLRDRAPNRGALADGRQDH